MADSRATGFAYSEPMALKRPLMFWIRYGAFCICLTAPFTDLDQGPGVAVSLSSSFWLKVAGTLLYAMLILRNIPARVRLRPEGGRGWLAAQFLLGLPLSPQLWTWFLIAMPFNVAPRHRGRWTLTFLLAFVGQMIVVSYMNHAFFPGPPGEVLHSPLRLLIFTTGIAGFIFTNLFAVVGASLIVDFAVGKQELERTNLELIALQAATRESARVEERLRIARELHDAAGHYLTSLSIQLEIAFHRASESVQPSIVRSRLITRLLLAEIREAVNRWREEESVNLPLMLERLRDEVDGVTTELVVENEIPALEPATIHALHRGAQEAMTNVLRHSGATSVRLALTGQADTVELVIEDNGRGCWNSTAGNGMNGIRSRLQEIGGWVTFETKPRQGFRVAMTAPVKREGQVPL